MAIVTVKGEKGVWVALNISNKGLIDLKQSGDPSKELFVEQDAVKKTVSASEVELYESLDHSKSHDHRVIDMGESQTLNRIIV